MRALVMTGFETAPALTELAVPRPAEGEVRVRVRAASVNGFDLAVAAGLTKEWMEHRFPLVIGKDFAGEVDAVGPGVTGFTAGDRVFGVVTKPYLGDGSFAEYVTVPTAVGTAPLPESVSFTEGGALGLAGTAARTVMDVAGLQAGESVLVVGAPGGVGTQVVQLAAAAGARVVATAHGDDERALVTRLGAAATVDPQGDLPNEVRALAPAGVDVVVHLAGDPSAVHLLREGGRFVSTLAMSPEQVPTHTAVVLPVHANPTREMLERCAHSQASGATTVIVQQTYPFDQVLDAFRQFSQGTLGKLVVLVG
jgi:NADPH:quinone reductase-like Zn-dependent oxidoreductase